MESHRRVTAIAVIVAITLLAAAAVTFARADQSLRVAADATVVAEAESGHGAAAAYRANLTIGVVAAASDSDAAAAQAAEAAGRTLGQLAESVRTAGGEAGDVDRLRTVHDRVSAALAAGDVDAADRLVSGEALPLVDDLQSDLRRISAEATARIEAERTRAGSAARVSSFVVALIAPALALWVFRRAARRRLDRERLAGELARQRDLAQAQQDLISGLSHQLRTPLTGIYGFAQALLVDPDPDFVPEAARTILGEANRLRAMVDDILVVDRSATGELAFSREVFDLSAEIQAAIEPFTATGAVVEVDCEPVSIVGDRLRVRHVLRNLLDNALRHGAPPVRVVGFRRNGYELAVCDAGPGPDTDPLFRTFAHSGDSALVTGSLGMGLGVCRLLCEGMGADLGLVREEAETRFVIRWPRDSMSDLPQPVPTP